MNVHILVLLCGKLLLISCLRSGKAETVFHTDYWVLGFPGDAGGKEPACQCGRHERHGFDPWVGKIPWRRAWQPTPVFLPGEVHGQRSLAGYSPWGHKELDSTEATACTHCVLDMHVWWYSFKFSILGVRWNRFDWLIDSRIHSWGPYYLKPCFIPSSITGDTDVGTFHFCNLLNSNDLHLLWTSTTHFHDNTKNLKLSHLSNPTP